MTAHTQLRCTIPAGGGRNVTVTVSRGAASDSEPWLSYDGPFFYPGTLKRKGSSLALSQGRARVSLPTTAAGYVLEVRGQSFLYGNNASSFVAFFGPGESPNTYRCVNIQALNDTYFECTTSAAVGTDLRLQGWLSAISYALAACFACFWLPERRLAFWLPDRAT